MTARLCPNCNVRPGTSVWLGDAGELEFARNPHNFPLWCMRCVTEKQLAHATKMAEQIPMLTERLATLDKEDTK